MLIRPMLSIGILFTNYNIITYFLNLAFRSEHFISIKHRILATFNKKKSILTACVPLTFRNMHAYTNCHYMKGTQILKQFALKTTWHIET